MSKKRNAIKKLQEESYDVFLFLTDCLEAEENSKIRIADLHTHYKQWRKYNALPKTILSVKGFGRMIPKSLARKYLYYSDCPHYSRSILHVRLKQFVSLTDEVDS